MSKVVHTINGKQYIYEHHRVGKRIICDYVGPVGGRGAGTGSQGNTQLSSSPSQLDSFGNPHYDSQDEFDAHIRKSYVRGGLGVRKIQKIYADELDLHPTRREIENHLQGMGVELRTRKKTAPAESVTEFEKRTLEAQNALETAREEFAAKEAESEISSRDQQIEQMKESSLDYAKEILRLKVALRDIRDKGRAPTDDEIEKLM